MKTFNHFFSGTLWIALIIVLLVIVSGCASTPVSVKTPDASASLTPTPVETVQTLANTPVTGQVSTTPSASAGTAGIITASLTNGVTISYPSDWQKEEVSELGLRDYGRTTLNIANFFSPDVTARRYKEGPNPDNSAYTTLSIDVDPTPVTDFEQYFNLVAIALQEKYGHIEITKHNYQLKISPTDTFPGYKSYQMDFDTVDMRGSYIFTNVDGTIYIFAFTNPSPYSSEVQEIYRSIQIVPVIDTSKHR